MSEYAWQGKLCPLLTIASSTPQNSSPIVTPGQISSGLTATACQGSRCMFFLTMPDSDGQLRGNGSCAVAALSVIASQAVQLAAAKLAANNGVKSDG